MAAHKTVRVVVNEHPTDRTQRSRPIDLYVGYVRYSMSGKSARELRDALNTALAHEIVDAQLRPVEVPNVGNPSE